MTWKNKSEDSFPQLPPLMHRPTTKMISFYRARPVEHPEL